MYVSVLVTKVKKLSSDNTYCDSFIPFIDYHSYTIYK